MAQRLRTHLQTAVVGMVTLALGVLAFVHDGVPAAEVDLNDGGVWITKGDQKLVGHLNYESRTLDGGLRAAGDDFDVSQSGQHVLLSTPDTVQPLDVAAVVLTGEAARAGIAVAHGGRTVLFADEAEGKVWAATVDGAAAFNSEADATIEDLDRPRIAVGVGGLGYIVDESGTVRTVDGAGQDAVIEEIGTLGEHYDPSAELTVVGDALVAKTAERLLTIEREFELPGLDEAVLQQPSDASPDLILSTRDSLLRIPLSGGQPTETKAQTGRPAAPVQLDGCAYGLWAQSGFYIRDCGSPELDQAAQYPELAAAAEPVFRTNRKVIVINDLVSGAAYLPLESMFQVDNWDLISSHLEEQEQEKESDDETVTEQSQIAEFSDAETPPEAKDDELGARAGAATTLPVLLNDFDQDGDVLTAVLVDTPRNVTLSLAKDGRAICAEVPADAVGSFSFTYRAFDGVHLSNVGNVRVAIVQPAANSAPSRVRTPTIHVAEQSTVEYSVLPDWIDPDGDPIFLADAKGEDGLKVTWRPDGYIAVTALDGRGPGRRVLDVTVSDGTLTQTAEIAVQVSPAGSNQPPVANNDHYVANVGETVTLRPLSNDTDPEGDELRVIELAKPEPGVTVTRDHRNDTIAFTAASADSYTLIYTIGDGRNTAKGKIRVDVSDPEEASEQPAAENDMALLPADGQVVIEPLANDFDPAGGVLVIQGTSMGSAKGLNVEVVRQSVLRITAPAGLTEPQAFEYTISNGRASATATVLVVPLEVRTQSQAPVAVPESTVVRAGDIVSVNVMLNDYSPSDLPLKLMPELQVSKGADLGEAFVAGEQVRFRANDDAKGTVELLYTIRDTDQLPATASVTIVVKDFSEGANQNPIPREVVARTFAGSPVNIPIPMDGIDPDGDSVELVGAQGMKLGSTDAKGSYLVYTPSPEQGGTDTFTYTVKDRFGAEGQGVVRVGVVPKPATNQAPVAVPDEIAARPNTRLEIPVVANDIDPDGDQKSLSLVAGSVEPVDDSWDPQAQIEGQRVIVVTPAEKGIYQGYYSVTDGGGAPVVGVFTVTVDENVPPIAPLARDDYVAANEITGLDVVDVDVLINDEDLDTPRDELVITPDAPATLVGGQVRVPLAADRQIVLYTITDPDGLTARAAIVVPGKDQIPPFIDPSKIPAKVKGGETLTIKLDEYVITRPDHTSKLTTADAVSAGPGGSTELPNGGLEVLDEKTITFTPDTLTLPGPSWVAFEVYDGDSLDDPRALKAALNVPIEIESSGLFLPELRPGEIKVAPGEDPVEVSLAAMVDDPDPGDNEKMAYSVVSASDHIESTVAGQSISVAVPADTPVGTAGQITVSVHDGTTDPQEMVLPVTVIRSTRPLMNVTPLSEAEGRVGQAITFNLADAVTNPFADQGGEIEIVGALDVQGPAVATPDGMVVTVTPTDSGQNTDGVENVVVTYTVADATKDPSRHRTGTINVTVKGVPNPPTEVAAEYVGSRTATVSWTASSWRGGKPKGFLVSWSGGSQECGVVAACTISTLPNNNEYTFTVSAQVEEADIQDSAPSAPSNAVFVDVAPNTPDAPSAKFGDESIDVTWTEPAVPDGGSRVTHYTVEISTPDKGGRTVMEQVTSTTLTWGNLTNGTPYSFRITAHNASTERNPKTKPPQGSWSEPEVPAGQPSLQGAPTVVKDKASALAPSATVTWAEPGEPNGDKQFVFELRQSGTTAPLYSGSERRSVVTMAVGTEDKTFEVRVKNKSNVWSDWSPVSNAVRAFQPPGAPTGFRLTPTGVANQAKFDFGAAPGNGARPGEIHYRWSAGGSSGTVTPGGVVTSAAFALGQNVSVTLTAIATVNGETAEGGSATATVNTYAPPGAPSTSARQAGNGNVDLSWNMSAQSNGRPITAVQLSTTDNANGGDVGLSGTRQQGSGPFQEKCITVRARNSEGQLSAPSTSCASTRGKGGGREYSGTGNNNLYVSIWDWYPNATITCRLVLAGGNVVFERVSVGPTGTRDFQWQNARAYRPGYVLDADISDDCNY